MYLWLLLSGINITLEMSHTRLETWNRNLVCFKKTLYNWTKVTKEAIGAYIRLQTSYVRVDSEVTLTFKWRYEYKILLLGVPPLVWDQ